MTKTNDHANHTTLPPYWWPTFQHTANELNCVIGIASINPYALYWIKNGFPTKPYGIKSKSTDVTYDLAPGLIKIIHPSDLKLLHNQQQPLYQNLPLRLQQSVIEPPNCPLHLNQHIMCHHVHDTKNISFQCRHTKEPIIVLHKLCLGQWMPVTSDIDLELVWPSLNHDDDPPRSNLIEPSIEHPWTQEYLLQGHTKQRVELIQKIIEFSSMLNMKTHPQQGALIHHADNHTNPYSDKILFPITLFIPQTCTLKIFNQVRHSIGPKNQIIYFLQDTNDYRILKESLEEFYVCQGHHSTSSTQK